MMPPGPRSPALWQTYQFVQHPRERCRKMSARYGVAVSFKSLLGTGIAVFDPELAREVFAAPHDAFRNAPVLEPLFGPRAVIATAGAEHRRQRKLLNPRFHGAWMKSLLGTMSRVIRQHLAAFVHAEKNGDVLAMSDLTQAMTLDVILETVFGESADMDRTRARRVLVDVIHAFVPSLVGGTFFHAPWFPAWRSFVHKRASFDAWVDELVRERRGKTSPGEDILGVLLAARYDDGEPMTDAEMRDHLLTLLMAGHETSAIAIAWGVYHLARSPEVLATLRSELDALGPSPSLESLTKNAYLGAVVAETLRIEPIVTDVVRVCREPFTVAGRYTLAPGEIVAVMLVHILQDATLYPEPTRFRPERFLERNFGPAEFLPFGGGARRCLGAAFAEAELAIALGAIASDWDVELADRAPERSVRRNITMGPERGVRIKVRRRVR